MNHDEKIKLCLHPDCGLRTYARGLCVKHYAMALRLVRKGETTWEHLEAAGRCLPTHAGKTAWFLEAEKAKA